MNFKKEDADEVCDKHWDALHRRLAMEAELEAKHAAQESSGSDESAGMKSRKRALSV